MRSAEVRKVLMVIRTGFVTWKTWVIQRMTTKGCEEGGAVCSSIQTKSLDSLFHTTNSTRTGLVNAWLLPLQTKDQNKTT